MATRSAFSRECLYSVESATSEEDEEEQLPPPPNGNLRVFFLDDGSDVGKEVRLPKHCCLNGPGFLFLPDLHGQMRKRWVRKPLRLQSPGPGCHCCPEVPGKKFCSYLVSPNGSLPRQRMSQKRNKNIGGYKRQSSATGGGQPLLCPVSPPEIKRQRKKEIAAEETLRSPSGTEGDHIFAQKCWELQGFVRPLSDLLDRLKTGCFDQGLSSFQQSVAMDRIQRIIGVLQKPQMGERYLGTLLQVEKMLKIWFPHIPLKEPKASCSVSSRKACGAAESCYTEDQTMGRRSISTQDGMLSSFSDLSSVQDHKAGTQQGEQVSVANGPAMNLTWIHTLPTLNPLLGQVDFSQKDSALGQILLGPNANNNGVVLFLQNVMATRAASETFADSYPSCMLFSDSGELSCCQSLPGILATGSFAPRGTFGGLFLLLPHLLMSEEELKGSEVSAGEPVKCHSS